MATAYTAGLTVADYTLITKTRRLPIKGEVLVDVGAVVEADSIVARATLPGKLQTVKAAEILGIEPAELPRALKIAAGDKVEKEQVIAQMQSFFGLFRAECKAPCSGRVEYISNTSGYIGIREEPIHIKLNAYIKGKVKEVLSDEGVVIETYGAFIQGIFGVGGERQGTIKVLVDSPEEALEKELIQDRQNDDNYAGKIIVGGSTVSIDALKYANEHGASAIIVGGIDDRTLIDYLGYDIGVAITGQEDIKTALVITEGFGKLPMGNKAFELLKTLDGMPASVCGATQIRAGVIRPEVIVPRILPKNEGEVSKQEGYQQPKLAIGSLVRLIRRPYFGRLCKVVGLPVDPQPIPTGAKVRVVEIQLLQTDTEVGKSIITVPRANIEIIE